MPLAFASGVVYASFIEFLRYFESGLMQGMVLGCSTRQIILGDVFAAVGFECSLLDHMPSLSQITNSARQSKALEPIQRFQSRECSARLQVCQDSCVLVVAFGLYWMRCPHKRQLKLLCFNHRNHREPPLALRTMKFCFLANKIAVG
jgi:hypothetical protein